MSKLQQGWINHLRNASRQDRSRPVKCPECDTEVPPEIEQFRAHVRGDVSKHGSLENDTAIEDAFRKITLKPSSRPTDRPSNSNLQARPRSARKRRVSGASGAEDTDGDDPGAADSSQRESKKICSPPASDVQQRGSSPPTTPTPTPLPRRSRARMPESPSEFDRSGYRNNRPARQLFNPSSDGPRLKNPNPKNTQRQQNRNRDPGRRPDTDDTPPQVDPDRPHTSMERQPETKPISHEQLVAEVKGIYTGLVMIESKCIEVDTAQSSNTDHQLSSEQWQALIALHRTLLHEHHDFFLASQHPAASEALKRLAAKYSMPARMWRHGIHSFLELLRHRLPASYDHMRTFIYLAYGMVALLYETVTAFEHTWIECLGDLARYRMAIEDNDIRDREIWTGVARSWYSLASEKAPTTGRLYHHLAILARPNASQQLYFYVKSLCVPIPFPSARESIMTLFDPLFSSNPPSLQQADAAFVRVHSILFSGKHQDKLDSSMSEYLQNLDSYIGRTAKKWLETGYYTGIPLACALLGYGAKDHFMMAIISPPEQTDVNMEGSTTSTPETGPDETFRKARLFMVRTCEIAIRRWGDPNTLPFLHTILVFIYHLSRHPAAMAHLENEFPWKLTVVMLNYLVHSCESADLRIDAEEFPGAPENDIPRPLPEDFAMRGLLYAQDYYPERWFKDSRVEEDEKYFELASMENQRKERLLWLGRRLVSSGSGKWITWDNEARKFGVAEPFANGADDISLDDAAVDPGWQQVSAEDVAAEPGSEMYSGGGPPAVT